MIKIDSHEKLYCTYDIESYFEDFILTFCDINGRRKYQFVNSYTCDFTGLSLREVVQENIIGAYNGYQYDDLMLTYMLKSNPNPRKVNEYNNYLFTLGDRDKQFMDVDKDIKSIDLMQQINTTINGKGGRSLFSLKHIMANAGYEVHETSVGFDIDRKLTKEELEKELEYCWNDTIFAHNEVYKTKPRRNYFMGKSNMCDEVINAEWTHYSDKSYWFLMRLTEGSLVTQLFKGIRSTPIDWDMNVPKDCLEIWRKNWFRESDKRPNYVSEVADNTLVLGYGGAHGVHKKIQRFTNVYHIDVASMYPTTIINYNILGQFTEYYNKLKEDRVKIKHSEPQKADGKKRVLNTTYGKLLEQGGKMSNRPGGLTVCFRGQEAIYNLALILHEFGTIAQINTDGVYFKPDSYDEDFEKQWRIMLEFWEEDYAMDLDVEFYKLLVQRDVNMYIAVNAKDKIKSKGLLGNHILDNEEGLVASNHKPYDFPIIYKAVVEKMINNTPMIDTIMNENNDIRMYQNIYQANKTFPYIAPDKDIERAEKQKVNRLICTNNGDSLYKAKWYDKEERSFTKKSLMEVGDTFTIKTSKEGFNVVIDEVNDDFIIAGGQKIKVRDKHKTIVGCKHQIGGTVTIGKMTYKILDIDGQVFTLVDSNDNTFTKTMVKNSKNFELELQLKAGEFIAEETKEEREFVITRREETDKGYKYYYEYPEGYRFSKISNLSKSAQILNGDVRGMTCNDFDIDFGYYLALASSFYNKFFN